MKWPKGFEPENSTVHARNEITIGAPPERVWRWLIRAANWPAWYNNSANIRRAADRTAEYRVPGVSNRPLNQCGTLITERRPTLPNRLVPRSGLLIEFNWRRSDSGSISKTSQIESKENRS